MVTLRSLRHPLPYRIQTLLGSVCILSMLWIGCATDPREASGENFASVVQEGLSAHPMCLGGGSGWVFPKSVLSDSILARSSGWGLTWYRTQDVREQFAALADAGLLSRHDGVPRPGYAEYRLTPVGEQAYRTYEESLDGRAGAFCYATPHVEEVVRYSEPADLLGQRVSEVTYTYTLQDVAPWAEGPALQEMVPSLAQTLSNRDTPTEGTAAVVLQSDGWQMLVSGRP